MRPALVSGRSYERPRCVQACVMRFLAVPVKFARVYPQSAAPTAVPLDGNVKMGPSMELTGGRHRVQETRPGPTRSSPVKNRASCAGLRGLYGIAPVQPGQDARIV